MSWVIQIEDQLITSENYQTFSSEDYTESWKKDILEFIEEWFSDNNEIELMTSGSTGKPKRIVYPKEMMKASATRTVEHFQLAPHQKALLCLPASFIAGKMMILRAIMAELELIAIKPSSDPLRSFHTELDFAAMTPQQLQLSLKNQLQSLAQVNKLIIGGAPVDHKTEQALLEIEGMEAYETFGMTETCSHIALRKMGHPFFEALHGVSFSVDADERLIIDDEQLKINSLKTNDVVELLDSEKFIWQGRSDWVVNSGGIKLHPELIERKLEALVPFPFFITGQIDPDLGEKLVMFYESEKDLMESELNSIEEKLGKYERPKNYYRLAHFKYLANGKLDRQATSALIS